LGSFFFLFERLDDTFEPLKAVAEAVRASSGTYPDRSYPPSLHRELRIRFSIAFFFSMPDKVTFFFPPLRLNSFLSTGMTSAFVDSAWELGQSLRLSAIIMSSVLQTDFD